MFKICKASITKYRKNNSTSCSLMFIRPNCDFCESKSDIYENNNSNLEISKGYEHYIPRVEEYDWKSLPQSIKDKIIE